METSKTRIEEWKSFTPVVLKHIEKYANAQYGDKGTDQLTGFTPADIKAQLVRYTNRIGTDMRGTDNQLLDCLKMAHYACALYWKYLEEDVGSEKNQNANIVTSDTIEKR
jgi:hypothetical protein